jgi:hypothetical protein
MVCNKMGRWAGLVGEAGEAGEAGEVVDGWMENGRAWPRMAAAWEDGRHGMGHGMEWHEAWHIGYGMRMGGEGREQRGPAGKAAR